MLVCALIASSYKGSQIGLGLAPYNLLSFRSPLYKLHRQKQALSEILKVRTSS